MQFAASARVASVRVDPYNNNNNNNFIHVAFV